MLTEAPQMNIALRLSKLIKENPDEDPLYISNDMFEEIFDYYFQELEIKSQHLRDLVRIYSSYIIHDGVQIRPEK